MNIIEMTRVTIPMKNNGYINECNILFLLIFCLHKQYNIPFSKAIPYIILLYFPPYNTYAKLCNNSCINKYPKNITRNNNRFIPNNLSIDKANNSKDV